VKESVGIPNVDVDALGEPQPVSSIQERRIPA